MFYGDVNWLDIVSSVEFALSDVKTSFFLSNGLVVYQYICRSVRQCVCHSVSQFVSYIKELVYRPNSLKYIR
jgi:hypothetical protein